MMLTRAAGHALNRAIVIAAAAMVLLVGGFAGFYYVDRYTQTSTSLITQEVDHLKQAIEADPSNLDARVAIAAYFLDANLLDDAIQQSEEVIGVLPEHQGALFVAGKAYLAKNNDDKVVEYFGKVVDLNKNAEFVMLNRDLGIVRYDLGMIYLKRQQFDRAEEAFAGSLAVNRADADSYYGIGQALLGQDKLDLAVDAFRMALRFDPEYVKFYEGLKTAYEKKGLTNQAAYAGAMMLYSTGDYTRAINELTRVTEAVPTFAEAYRALGMSHEKAGNKDEAVKAYRRALDLDPGDRAAQQGLGRLTTGGQ